MTNLAFAFPAVSAPDTLGIEKEITFVGVAGNTTWGDGTLDDGTTPAAEGSIMIREFPTPEPASVALVGLGVLLMRRRH